MSQQKLLNKVIKTLEFSNVNYMLTGSFVSSLQGEPRATHDIDIIVELGENNIKNLKNAFPEPDFYLNENSIKDAIKLKQMFNLIDNEEGDKVDFWILTNTPFDQSRFSRRVQENILGIKIQVSRPEDTILAKLHWAKLSESYEKQFIDALRIYEVQYNILDIQYIEKWINNLKLEKFWESLLNQAKPIN